MIKTKNAIDHMRYVGQLTAKVLEAVKPMIQPGISTLDIDTFCHDYIVQQLQATPGSLGQYGSRIRSTLPSTTLSAMGGLLINA